MSPSISGECMSLFSVKKTVNQQIDKLVNFLSHRAADVTATFSIECVIFGKEGRAIALEN